MINISEKLKNIYKNDHFPYMDEPAPKELIIHFPAIDLTIETDRIVDDSFELYEKLCSEEDLVFGSCEASQIKFTVADVEQDLKGLWFSVRQIVNDTYTMPLGVYKVDSCTKQDNLRFKDITAYDKLKSADVDVASWYNGLFPTGREIYTLEQFGKSFLNYLGLEEDTVMTMPNSHMAVEKTISPTQISGREVLRAWLELQGAFGHIGRDGKFKRIVLQPAYGLYPAEKLYPSDDLYPVDANDKSYINETLISENVSSAMYKSVRFEEYTTREIDKLQIRSEENDIGSIVGAGSNTYIIEGNFLVFGKSAAELEVIARNAFGNMAKRPYRPYEAESIGLPYVEVGDTLEFATDDIVTGYVLQRTLKGIQALTDEYTATGNEEREQNFGVNKEIIQLQGKSTKIQKDVDGIKIEVENIETSTNTKFEQTDEKIALEAQRATGAEDTLSGQIEVMAGQVVLKVDTNGNIAAVELDADPSNGTSIKLKADNISLEGYVSLNGNTKIRPDGTLEAVDGIFSGTLNGVSITNDYITIDRQFIRFNSGGAIKYQPNNDTILSFSNGYINIGNYFNSNLTTVDCAAKNIRLGTAGGGSSILIIGPTTFKTSTFSYITLDDTGIYPDSSNYFALGKSNKRFDYAHIRSIYTDSIYHQSDGALGFFGKTPVSRKAVSKLSTSATQSEMISRFNALLDALGDSSGYGIIKL